MSTELEEQTVEYVEYLNTEEYDENQEIVTVDDSSMQEVEYVEAEEVNCDDYDVESEDVHEVDGHTIFEHNGKRYMIPNELHQSGQTIVLQDYEEEDNGEYILPAEDEGNEILQETQEVCEEMEEEVTYYDEDCEEEEEAVIRRSDILEPDEHVPTDDQCYMIYGEDVDNPTASDGTQGCGGNEALEGVSKQYAVLKDGKLHIQNCELGDQGDDDGDSGSYQDKLQVLEDSLNYQADQEEGVEITGKNLITGQTISLNGFLEKLKKKTDTMNVKREPADNDYYPPSVKRQRRSFYNQTKPEKNKTNLEVPKPNYVLMPPVNKKVVVGKTSDGKKIVGKILQIWKKVDPNVTPAKPRTIRRRPQNTTQPIVQTPQKPDENTNEIQQEDNVETLSANEQIEELIIDNTGKILHVENLQNPLDKSLTSSKNILLKKKYVSKAFLDQNIVKTLSGLMGLESVQKNLADKNLIIKHILKKSFEGKIIPGKEVTYYYGHMEKSDIVDCFNEVKVQWTFVSDYRGNQDDKPEGIDLAETPDRQQVDEIAESKPTFGALTDPELTDAVAGHEPRQRGVAQEYDETVPVNLIVIEDEYGKKRTKVTIPQMGGSPKCQICQKMFRSEVHLKRHMQQHSTDGNFVCEVCKKTFCDITSLFKHNRVHSGEKEYTCYICNKAFNSPGSLKRHITVHDPSLRPLQCLTCLQRFTDESSLKKHMLLHTGLKPFQCDLCLKCFVHQGDLNFHRKIHDPVKRYQCQICGKEFNRHSNMIRHAEIHKGGTASAYKCEMCGCQYNFISSLTRHIVNNHMNKPDDADLGDEEDTQTHMEDVPSAEDMPTIEDASPFQEELHYEEV